MAGREQSTLRRDVTLGEDASQVRSGVAPEVMSSLCNVAVHLLATDDADNGADAIGRLAARFEEAINLLSSPT